MNIRDTIKKAPGCRRRERDATATRKAILDAARTLFSQDSYEHVTVRDIASRAGIDPALVIRYFGSKEDLFLTAISIHENDCGASPVEGDLASLGQHLMQSYVSHSRKQDANDPLLIMIRSAHCHDISGILRKALEEQFLNPLAAKLGGPDAHLRAELALSQIIGLNVMQSFIHSEALGNLPDNDLARVIGEVIQHYLEADLSSTPEKEETKEKRERSVPRKAGAGSVSDPRSEKGREV